MADAGFHPVKWFLSNKFRHIEAFLVPSLDHGSVSVDLRRRFTKRIKSAKRLVLVRAALYVLLASSLVGAIGGAAFDGLTQITDAAWIDQTEDVFNIIMVVAGALTILATPALFVVMRTLSLLEADLYILGMEIVASNVGTPDGIRPSRTHVGEIDGQQSQE